MSQPTYSARELADAIDVTYRRAHFLNQGMTLRNAFEHAHRGPGVLAALTFTADDFDLITQALRFTAGPEGVISLDHEQRQRILAIADELST